MHVDRFTVILNKCLHNKKAILSKGVSATSKVHHVDGTQSSLKGVSLYAA